MLTRTRTQTLRLNARTHTRTHTDNPKAHTITHAWFVDLQAAIQNARTRALARTYTHTHTHTHTHTQNFHCSSCQVVNMAAFQERNTRKHTRHSRRTHAYTTHTHTHTHTHTPLTLLTLFLGRSCSSRPTKRTLLSRLRGRGLYASALC